MHRGVLWKKKSHRLSGGSSGRLASLRFRARARVPTCVCTRGKAENASCAEVRPGARGKGLPAARGRVLWACNANMHLQLHHNARILAAIPARSKSPPPPPLPSRLPALNFLRHEVFPRLSLPTEQQHQFRARGSHGVNSAREATRTSSSPLLASMVSSSPGPVPPASPSAPMGAPPAPRAAHRALPLEQKQRGEGKRTQARLWERGREAESQ